MASPTVQQVVTCTDRLPLVVAGIPEPRQINGHLGGMSPEVPVWSHSSMAVTLPQIAADTEGAIDPPPPLHHRHSSPATGFNPAIPNPPRSLNERQRPEA
jgi:hypothetical protein